MVSETAEVRAGLCPMCGGGARAYMREAHTSIWRCMNLECQLQYAAPQLDHQALEHAYATLYYPPGDGDLPTGANTTARDNRALVRAIEERFGPAHGRRVLDYGCGSGGLLQVFRQAGAEVAGIELSAIARQRALQAGISRIYRDLAELRGREGEIEFDWVVSCDSIEHLRKPWEDLGELRPFVKRDGNLVVKTPNFESLKGQLKGRSWDQRTNVTHFFYFTPASLAAVLRRAGFDRITEWRPLLAYSNHGFARLQFQRMTIKLGWQGALIFTASASMDGRPAG